MLKHTKEISLGVRQRSLLIIAGVVVMGVSSFYLSSSYEKRSLAPRHASDGKEVASADRSKVSASPSPQISPAVANGELKERKIESVRKPLPIRNRMEGAEVFEVEEEKQGTDHMSRIRILRLEEDGPLIRVEEQLTTDREGEWILISQEAMRADQILALPSTDEAHERLEILAEQEGYTLVKNAPHSSILRILLPDAGPDAVPKGLQRFDPLAAEGILVEPDFLYFPNAQPNDPGAIKQWALERIEAEDAWAISTGSEEIVVAVIDSGIDLDHEDLIGNLWINPLEIENNQEDDDGNEYVDDINGWDFVDNDNSPDDGDGHGTHVSGIIGAKGDNGSGVAGVNWNVRLLPLKTGSRTFSTSSIIAAMDYVLSIKEQGVPVVATNNSYGSLSFSNFMRNAINRHRDAGIIFVAAAGNESRDNDESPSYPASYDIENVISVASTTGADNLSSFSNHGATSVHLGAPGSKIYSTIDNSSYGYKDGTSMATPQVAGAVALVTAADRSLNWREVKDLILTTADPVPDLEGKTSTGGRLNLRKAVEGAAGIKRPELRIISPKVPAVRLVAPGLSLYLAATLEFEGGQPTPQSGVFQWSSIPENNNVVFEDPHSLDTVTRFNVAGSYRIQASYEDGAYRRTRELYVTVEEGEILTSDLSAWWKFDESSGQTAVDSSGTERHGEVEGATWVDGLIDGALRFNGKDESVSFPAPSLTQFTLSAWFKTESAGNSVFPRIFNLPEFLLYLGRRDNDYEPDQKTVKFFANRTRNDGVWNSSKNVVQDAQWFHIAASFDAEDSDATPALYLDGVPLTVGPQSVPNGSRAADGETGYIGDDGEDTRAFDGIVDDMRIYNRILAPSEIGALAEGPDLNTAPWIKAGGSRSTAPGELVNLSAEVEDPDTSLQLLSFKWVIVDGPATVDFSDPTLLNTQVRFPVAGEYRLRLFADDANARSAEDLLVSVEDATIRDTGDDSGNDQSPENHVANTIWPSAVDLGDGWKSPEWFGVYRLSGDPWIFHNEHGWLFVVIEEIGGFWLFSEELGWLYTSESLYPNLYWYAEDTWLWYQRGSTAPRIFFNFRTEQWESFD